MRTIIISILAIVCSVFLYGCLESYTTVIVKRDGSARVIDSVIASGEAGAIDTTLPDRSEIEKKLREHLDMEASKLGKGAKLQSIRFIGPNSDMGFVAEYSIPSINDLSITTGRGFSMLGDDNIKAGEDMNKPITFLYTGNKLTIQSPGLPKKTTPKKNKTKSTKTDAQLKEEMQAMVSMFPGEMRLALYVQTEQPVIKSNASVRTNNTITMLDLDFVKLLKTLAAKPALARVLEESEPSSPAEIQKVLQKLPKGLVAIETQPIVTVTF